MYGLTDKVQMQARVKAEKGINGSWGMAQALGTTPTEDEMPLAEIQKVANSFWKPQDWAAADIFGLDNPEGQVMEENKIARLCWIPGLGEGHRF
jgi:hypothetical protein